MRILVCEDDPSIRRLLAMLLAADDHDVLTACNGAEGLARMQDDQGIEVVITDGNMPLVTGPMMLRAIAGRRPAAIGITCDPDRWAGALRQAGCSAVICKPFEVEELLAAVRTAGLRG